MQKKIGKLLGAVISLLVIIIGISLVNHKIQLSAEETDLIPKGQMVDVNGHKMHVYSEGQGPETLVFMAGGGTCSPFLDFKSLYTLLSHQYKIVVVEKAGYGLSEDLDISRDIKTMLEETRAALDQAGLSGPYILFPHSASGIEALYWGQQYPEEVKGIVGLDMAVPPAYEDFLVNEGILKLGQFAAKIGFTRFIPGIVNKSAAIQHGTLTDKEKDLYRKIFYRSTSTLSMLKEVKEIKSNAAIVKEREIPEVSMLLFTSNGEGTGWDPQDWIESQESYIKNVSTYKQIKLDCSHYCHTIEYETIAAESQAFIELYISQDPKAHYLKKDQD